MNFILFDGPNRVALKPLTYTRPVAELRIGLMTLRARYEHHLKATTSTLTEDYLSETYPMVEMEINTLIDASIIPTEAYIEKIKALNPGEKIISNQGRVLAFCYRENEEPDLNSFKQLDQKEDLIEINAPYDLFAKNDFVFRADFEALTEGRTSQSISDSNRVLGENQIFIEEGARVEFSILNAETGPIYISKNALVMEGSMIRGPFHLGEGSVVKMGAKMYGPISVGPKCTLGGEIKNSVIIGNSSKGHEGYLGDSVLGEWCNLGADTNNSNLKNNYTEVKLWNYEHERFMPTGLQFCGLIMGDHSKCGINTMFNTGTVVGVAANIFGGNYQRNFIPSFAWGGDGKFITYRMNKVEETAKLVFERKGKIFTEAEKKILEHVFEDTSQYRKWE
jgi:UDP-N-acetylglucosamine diphosphorylase/glucosamine-1-phosphate N-acetyltransferase